MTKTYSKKVKGIDLTPYTEVEIYQMVLDGTLGRFPPGFWNCDEATTYAPKIVKYLIEEKLKWSIEDIKNNLSIKTFADNDMRGLLYYFNNSPFKAIDSIYPGKIKPWELKYTPMNYWNDETSKLAINWLVYEKLKWSKEKAEKELTQKILIENNLNSIVHNLSMQEIKDLIY